MNSVDSYLRDIGRVPLLTHKQEITLGRKVRQQQEILESFPGAATDNAIAAQAMAALNLSHADYKRIMRRGQRAKEQMVAANLRLVVSVAKRHHRRCINLELLDLIQEGSLGLMRAAELFDPTRGYKFSTFAYWHISQKITRAIDDKESLIRIPAHMGQAISKATKLVASGEASDFTEAIASTRCKPALVSAALRCKTVSLNTHVGGSGRQSLRAVTELGDLIPAPEPDESLANDILMSTEKIIDLVDQLPGKRPTAVKMRYGLGDFHCATYEEIAEQIGVGRETVRQLVCDSYSRLKKAFEEQGLIPGQTAKQKVSS
jgi:RNA polymerase nonessential primary-like sigma factor